MLSRSISFACMLLLTGCGPKAPEVLHIGEASFRFPRDPFYRSLADQGAAKLSFVAYATPENDKRQSIVLEYDSSENIKDRIDAENQGLPYIPRGSFQFKYAKDAFVVRRPWGTSICLRGSIKVGLLRSCATNVTYRGARWAVYFQHDMLDDPINVIARGVSVLRAYSIDA